MKLFSFNDEFIAEMSGGLSDDDTLELFAEAIESMAAEVEDHMVKNLDHPVEVKYDEDDRQLYVEMGQEEWDREFGTSRVPMQPRYRQSFIQSINDARRAFDEVVNDLA